MARIVTNRRIFQSTSVTFYAFFTALLLLLSGVDWNKTLKFGTKEEFYYSLEQTGTHELKNGTKLCNINLEHDKFVLK